MAHHFVEVKCYQLAYTGDTVIKGCAFYYARCTCSSGWGTIINSGTYCNTVTDSQVASGRPSPPSPAVVSSCSGNFICHGTLTGGGWILTACALVLLAVVMALAWRKGWLSWCCGARLKRNEALPLAVGGDRNWWPVAEQVSPDMIHNSHVKCSRNRIVTTKGFTL